MRTPHSSTNKGKRVKVTLRNGGIVIGRFKDKKSGLIILEDSEETRNTYKAGQDFYTVHTKRIFLDRKIHMKDVRAFSIYKPTT